jgi:hypothetical protein
MIKKYDFSNLISKNDNDSLIELVNQKFETGDWHKDSPTFQTYPDLFEYDVAYKFKNSFLFSCYSYMKMEIKWFKLKAWCYMDYYDNWITKDKDAQWHHHPAKLSGIFYLYNPKSVKNYPLAGTEFLEDGIPNIIPEDFCWFIYPSEYIHRPGQIQTNEKRYTLAADLYF